MDMTSLLDGNSTLNETSCPSYEGTHFKILAAIRAGIGTASAVCCLVVIIVIFFYKKYKFFTQRLVLYLAVAAFFQSLCYPLGRVNYYTDRAVIDHYCYFAGYIYQYSNWTEVLCIVCITANISTVAAIRKQTARLEVLYVLFIFLLPLLWCWVPFLHATYGTAGPWCGIRTLTEDCEYFNFGRILSLATWTGPLYLILTVAFVVTCISACRVHRAAKRWSGKFSPEMQAQLQETAKQIKPLLWYPVIYMLLETPTLVNQIYHVYDPRSQIMPLWYLETVFGPPRGAFIALVYAFDSETRARVRCRHFCAAWWSCCKPNKVTEYPVVIEREGDSILQRNWNRSDYIIYTQTNQPINSQ